MANQSATAKEETRKNYPGDTRTPGTKDYALILSSLINRRNDLIRSEDEDESIEIIVKIAEKMKELGFEKAAETTKQLVKRKINTSYKWRDDRFEGLDHKKATAIELAETFWNKGKEKHQKIKEKSKR